MVEGFSWDDLRYLEAIERLGSVGHAARELQVSASTIYRRVALLEKSFEARCLAQGGAQGRLTETGQLLAAVAKETSTAIGRVQQNVRSSRSGIDGEVSLTTVDGFVPLLAAPLAALGARYPRLCVTLHIADQGPSVRRREVDIALAVVPKPPAGLWGRRLFAIRYGAFGTSAALDVTPARWICSERTGPLAAWERQFATHVALQTRSVPAVMAAVRAGIGLAVLPRRLAALEPDLREATAFSASLESLDRPAWLLTHPEIRHVPRVRAVMECLTQALK